MDYLEELSQTLANKRMLAPVLARIVAAIAETRKLGGTVYTAGNGGSAATAMHFTNDLMKLAGSNNIDRAVKSVCLAANPPVLTCLSNDLGYDEAFIYQYEIMASKGIDVLFGISCSGGSRNVYKLLWVGKQFYRTTNILLTGNARGICRDMADYVIEVPHADIRIQEDVHLAICHIIAGELRDRP